MFAVPLMAILSDTLRASAPPARIPYAGPGHGGTAHAPDDSPRTPFSDMADQLYWKSVARRNPNHDEQDSAQHGAAPYVMQRGDTLWGVSQRTGIPLENILTANPHVGDPTGIPVGTTLNLPHESAQPANPAEQLPHPAYADNQPLDAETAKKYGVDPGTTWRVVRTGQKVTAFWRAIENGEKPAREQALALKSEIAKLRAAPDISPRELQEVRSMSLTHIPLAYHNGNITVQEVAGDPGFIDAALAMPSGGGASRLPGAPLGAGMNMIRPGDSSVDRLNQQIGLSLPRSPIPRDLPAPPTKRRQ